MKIKRHISLFIATALLLFASCSKQDGEGDEVFDTHSMWTDSTREAFWDKYPDGGIPDGDTTIFF